MTRTVDWFLLKPMLPRALSTARVLGPGGGVPACWVAIPMERRRLQLYHPEPACPAWAEVWLGWLRLVPLNPLLGQPAHRPAAQTTLSWSSWWLHNPEDPFSTTRMEPPPDPMSLARKSRVIFPCHCPGGRAPPGLAAIILLGSGRRVIALCRLQAGCAFWRAKRETAQILTGFRNCPIASLYLSAASKSRRKSG